MSRKHEITAFIYDKRGRLLSMGKNSYVKTHPLQAKHASACGTEYKVFLHAEIAAITKCRDIKNAYRMVITRFDENGVPGNAKPCSICQRAISFTNLVQIEHT